MVHPGGKSLNYWPRSNRCRQPGPGSLSKQIFNTNIFFNTNLNKGPLIDIGEGGGGATKREKSCWSDRVHLLRLLF